MDTINTVIMVRKLYNEAKTTSITEATAIKAIEEVFGTKADDLMKDELRVILAAYFACALAGER